MSIYTKKYLRKFQNNMAKQRYINTKFWSDPYIQELDTNCKLFYLYLLTNEHTNISGIYEISLKTICFDIGLSEKEVSKCIDTLSKGKKVFFIQGHIILCNFPKHQDWQNSPKIKQGIEALLSQIPDKVKESIHTLSIPYLYPLNYSNLNSNSNYMATLSLHNQNSMNTEELNDGDITYEEESPHKSKKYGNKRKLYSKLVLYYMKLLGKTGNVVRFFPAMKEIYELHLKDFPQDTEEQIEREIKGRIKVAHEHYTKLGFKEWGLGKIAENWDLILTWKI